jgi:type IV pilus assembly protein PilQ
VFIAIDTICELEKRRRGYSLKVIWVILLYFIALVSAHAEKNQLWTIQLAFMPTRYLLQTLAELTHQNIALSQSIQGKIDLHLDKVSWQQLWQFLVLTQHLQIQKSQGIMWVDKAYSFTPVDKKAGGEPLIVHAHINLKQIEVGKVKSILSDKMNSCLSPIGKVLIDDASNSVWLSDLPEYIDYAKQVIQQIDTKTPQIEIEARIVSINKNHAKDLGIRMGFTQPGLMSGQLAGIHSESENKKNLNIDLPAVPIEATPMTYALAVAKLGQQYIDAELSALEGQGKAEIISSPRLMTENQQEASISSGEDIPYQESSLNGATSVAFKKALLLLKVRPYLLANHRLILELQINQDADSGRRVQGVPVISTKSISTKVIIDSGQTLVLGGIHKNDMHMERVGFPILKDLPFIGYVFSRQQRRQLDEELLLFITPKII